MARDEFFGNADQQALLRRGQALAVLTRDDSRYSYYGRAVGLVEPADGDIDQLAALAVAQGNSNYSAVPSAQVAGIISDLEARDLVPLHYAKWEGAETALTAAQQVADSVPLPGDLTIVRVDATTPFAQLQSFADMALACSVLPMSGDMLRGNSKPAICLLAVDPQSNVVSCAAAASFAHPDHATYGGQAWWGMLATDPARRGQRLALILGAQAMLQMNTEFGYCDFMTGVEPGNAPSEAVCRRMGLAPQGYSVIGCADPRALASGRMTK